MKIHVKRISMLTMMFTLIIGSLSCSYLDAPKRKFGPKETTSLVVVFRKGVSQDAIHEFDETVISIPHNSGNGIWSLPGISSGYSSYSNGYEIIGINFAKDATEEQQKFVKQRVLASDLVLCIHENVKLDELNLPECGSEKKS